MRQGQQKRMRGRNRPGGGSGNGSGGKGPNPLTRSYESNGPDVKVRGTPALIAEKYVQLARDAQTSGDPILAESYLQHAEHYFRVIAAAQPQFNGQPYAQADEPDDGEDADFDGPIPSMPQIAPPPVQANGGDEQGRPPQRFERDRGYQDRGYQGSQDRGSQDRGSQDRGYQDRGAQDRGYQDRGSQDRGFERQGQERSNQERSNQERQWQDRQGQDRQGQDRPNQDRPNQDRPNQDRQSPDRYEDRAGGERPSYTERPQGERFQGERFQGERPQGDRYQGDRYPNERPGSRPGGERFRDRFNDRPRGDRAPEAQPRPELADGEEARPLPPRRERNRFDRGERSGQPALNGGETAPDQGGDAALNALPSFITGGLTAAPASRAPAPVQDLAPPAPVAPEVVAVAEQFVEAGPVGEAAPGGEPVPGAEDGEFALRPRRRRVTKRAAPAPAGTEPPVEPAVE